MANDMSKVARTVAIVLLALAIAVPGGAQQSPKPEITGRVVDETGAPLEGVSVGLYRVGLLTEHVVVATDEEGRFASGAVEDGVFAIYAAIEGYTNADESTERLYRPGDSATIRIVRGGVITGKVTNADGEPVVAMAVSAQRVRTADGEVFRGERFVDTSETDDRGVYRIYGLAAGAFVVYAGRASNPWSMPQFDRKLARIYYPSSADRPTEVDVQLGAETTNIDIVYRKVSGHSISGTVVGGDENVYVEIKEAKSGQQVGWAQAERRSAGGGFEISGLSDGDYELTASAWADKDKIESTRRVVTIRGADVAGVTLELTRLGRVEGHIVWDDPVLPEGCSKPGDRRDRAVLVELRRETKPNEPRDAERGAVKSGGEFEVANLRAGSYQLGIDLPGRHWYVAAIERERAGARPASAAGRPITVSQGEAVAGYRVRLRGGAASLSGRVTTGEGQTIPDGLTLHLVPAEKGAAGDLLRYYEVEVERDGRFALASLAPGEYLVLVRPRAEPAVHRPVAWDEATRASLRREAEASGRPLTLAPCQTVDALGLAAPRP